jgi:Polymer-forming cytoskeletal
MVRLTANYTALRSLSPGGHVTGTVAAERVVVDGKVEGPIQGRDVVLKSQAHVVGDIHHQSLAIEKVRSLMVVRCRSGKTGKRLKDLNGNRRGKFQTARPSPAGLSGPNRWKGTSWMPLGYSKTRP